MRTVLCLPHLAWHVRLDVGCMPVTLTFADMAAGGSLAVFSPLSTTISNPMLASEDSTPSLAKLLPISDTACRHAIFVRSRLSMSVTYTYVASDAGSPCYLCMHAHTNDTLDCNHVCIAMSITALVVPSMAHSHGKMASIIQSTVHRIVLTFDQQVCNTGFVPCQQQCMQHAISQLLTLF